MPSRILGLDTDPNDRVTIRATQTNIPNEIKVVIQFDGQELKEFVRREQAINYNRWYR